MSQERPIRLHAGAWSVEFERWSGWIRCIRLGETEVLRAVYSVVRGDDWTTMSQRVVTSHVSQEDGHFEATWKAELDDMDFSWEGRVWCDGTELQIETIGVSGQTYHSRRTGMCVLHPREVAGLPCTIQHQDGSGQEGAFPGSIEPEQPFFDIKTIRHQVGNAHVSIEFKGEVFEMEDQRNYSDVSFKTYVRPQAWPQPFEVNEGDRFHHGISISFEGEAVETDLPSRVNLTESEQWLSVPRLGTYGHKHAEEFDFLLDPKNTGDWTPAGLGVLHQAGSFIEFNRTRSIPEGFEGIAFGATPQVHAFDERTIMENALGLADLATNAKEFSGGKVVAVGPLMLKNRRQDWDDRLERDLGPVWLLASLVSLTQGGADAVCILRDEDFNDNLLKALRLLRSAGQIRILHSSDPYRVIGFEFGSQSRTTVLINLRPYISSAHYHTDLELEPYEIRVIESE